jgi:hypothetical protein
MAIKKATGVKIDEVKKTALISLDRYNTLLECEEDLRAIMRSLKLGVSIPEKFMGDNRL